MSRRGRGRPQRLRTPTKPRRVIRVHTEGEVTEPGYLEELGRRYRDTIRIDSGEAGRVPVTLVDHACRDVDENRRAERRGQPLYDEVWCVFDVDAHPNIDQAVDRALQKGVRTAVSNPCFELWLVLHVQDQTGYIGRREVQRLARELGLVEGKAIKQEVFDDLVAAYEDAKKRARQLDQKHLGDGSSPRSNPSTGVWRLVDAIQLQNLR